MKLQTSKQPTHIPAREQWLFDNKDALNSLNQGLQDAAKRQLHDLGSFAKYADD